MKSEALPLPSRLKPSLPALGVASLLAAGTNAYGQIIYTNLGAGVVVSSSSFSPNVDGIGGADFTLTNNHPTGEGATLRFFSSNIVGAGEGSYAFKLTAGTTIGSGFNSFNSYPNRVFGDTYGSSLWGTFGTTGPIRGYVGFKFFNSTFTYFGWIDLEIVGGVGGNASATVFGYAYESGLSGIMGNPIQAGAIPEPAPVALVIGAAALLAFRQRRRKAA